MIQPQPQGISFPDLMTNVERGLVKIPQFQRDFVWTLEKSAKLLDSMLKGYPIGTFILWKTKESLKNVRNIGNAELPETPAGQFVEQVLDGQQRLTSLYASYRGLKVQRDERTDDFSELYVDLDAAGDDQVAIVGTDGKDADSLVRVVDLLNADLAFLAAYPEKRHQLLSDYKKRLETYSFSTILVNEAPLDVATEIFTRINVTGKPLTVFEIMVAKTFDAERAFDLSWEYDRLHDKLAAANYETISATVILQVVSAILTKECAKKNILGLRKGDFIDIWKAASDSVELAVDYLRNFYRIPVSRLLPYGALLVPFSYFFYNHPEKPTGETQRSLQDLFWRVSLGGRYSYSLEARLAQDIKRVDEILAGKLPDYDYPVDTSAAFVRDNGYFNAGRAYVKAILCILAYNEPKSFDNNAIVWIGNGWLKQVNSKNYHHFFPRAYLKKQGYEDWEVNHVANVTIVDDYLNKRKIGSKAPSIYMSAFRKDNSGLKATMKTHLIDLDRFGIWDNDYDTFFWKRCQAISRRLGKRVIHRDIDQQNQGVHTDDYEEAFEEGQQP